MPSRSFKPTRDRKKRRRNKNTKGQDVPDVDADGTPARATTASTNERPTTVADSNAEVMVPLTAAEKAERRRQQLKEELKAGQPKMSAKKRKRFDKYIETKLKKEETAALLAKLAETKIDTSLFTSTRTIGASKESKKQQIKRALLEERAGINSEQNKAILYEERQISKVGDGDDGGDGDDEGGLLDQRLLDTEEVEEREPRQEQPNSAHPSTAGVVVGAGLKRPLDGEEGGPSVIKRIKMNRKPRKEPLVVANEPKVSSDDEMETSDERSSGDDEECDEEEWHGFSEAEGSGGSSSDESSPEDEGSSDGSDGSDDGESEEAVDRLKWGRSEKANAFKEWALAQKRATVDGETSAAKSNIEAAIELNSTIAHVPRRREEDMTPPPEELAVAQTDRKVHYVTIPRPEDIQTARLALPVVAEEQRIMEAIHSNSSVVICGETGSGKTTQVPQFLYEAGYGSPGSPTPGLIGVTQPRRVAAVSMANRVGSELGPGGSEKVSYQIRFDGTVGPNTAIKFMTDGILLRELADDFLLRKYSAIVIDEAHERSINTDILIGVMSRVVRLRENMGKQGGEIKPLKLIIMSATLRVSDFVENQTLFSKPPPLLQVDARQHPVTIHFSRRTASDYVEEAFKKVCRINRRLPPGGILVFLTGQNEILTLLGRLKQAFPAKYKQQSKRIEGDSHSRVRVLASEAIVETEDVELGEDASHTINSGEEDPISDYEDQDLGEEMGDVDVDLPLHVLPLYSLLPTKEQLKVFDDPPEGTRLCVLATNVAETSLTIPGIRYVVDCGRSKERNYDRVTGVQSFNIQWASKASASQRAGRAGRTGPGHCYRLYSSAVYEADFEKFAEPELLRMPIEGVVLQMKAMNIDTIVNFPFPTPPDRDSLYKAEKLLGYLRAIATDGSLTELGRTMNLFPLSPRFAKILMIGQQHRCLPYVIAIVSALSVGDIFVPEQQLGFNDGEEDGGEGAPPFGENAARDTKSKLRADYYRAHVNFASLDAESDAIKLLSVVCAFEYEKNPADFCSRSFVRLKAMEETRKLRQQITKIVMANCPGVLPKFEAKLPPPSKLQVKALKQIVAAGFIDNVAIRADLLPNSDFKLNKVKLATQIPFVTLFPSSSQPSAEIEDRSTFLHASSVLASSQNVKPEYVVYSELTRSSTGSGRVWMKPLTTIKGGQLASLAEGTPLITYSKPLESKPPRILPDSDGRRREVWVVPRVGAALGKSGLGWSLPPQRIIQKREGLLQKWVKE